MRCHVPYSRLVEKKSNNLKLSVIIDDNDRAPMGLETLIKCNPKIFLDGAEISLEEVEMLVSQMEGLSFIKG